MTTASTVIKKASSYIGVKEKPRNSNNVIFNTDYYGRKVKGAAYPWCVTFVWDIFRMCKASKLFYDGKKTAYCPAVLSWGKAKKLTKKTGKKGDIVLFDWDHDGVADHIGFIEKKNADGTYTTIEGNTAVGNDSNGGMVMRRIRNKNTVIAFIRPKYAKEVKPAKKKPAAKPVKKKSNKQIAKEVIAGKWGTGEERKKKLKKAGYNYAVIQEEVNKLAKPKVVVKGKLLVDLNVRKGAGTKYPVIKVLKKGTVVKCKSVTIAQGDTWWKIDSGYICVKYKGRVYVKQSS